MKHAVNCCSIIPSLILYRQEIFDNYKLTNHQLDEQTNRNVPTKMINNLINLVAKYSTCKEVFFCLFYWCFRRWKDSLCFIMLSSVGFTYRVDFKDILLIILYFVVLGIKVWNQMNKTIVSYNSCFQKVKSQYFLNGRIACMVTIIMELLRFQKLT